MPKKLCLKIVGETYLGWIVLRLKSICVSEKQEEAQVALEKADHKHQQLLITTKLPPFSADVGGGGGRNQYKLPGPDYVAYVFVFPGSIIIWRLYILNL